MKMKQLRTKVKQKTVTWIMENIIYKQTQAKSYEKTA